jgi:hypothetical protein
LKHGQTSREDEVIEMEGIKVGQIQVRIGKSPIPKTITFRGRKYKLDQIYWDRERAEDETAEVREHGYWYARLVTVVIKGETKYARYISPVKMVQVRQSRRK